MHHPSETEVLIVGAGPVGLTLALDLARRGIDVVVVERRQAGEPPRIRTNHISARSMEIFRRLGIAKALREVGLPESYPNDVAIRTTVTGIELARIRIPSRAERYTAKEGPDTWWPTPEPAHRANQIHFEPLLFAHAQSQSHIQIISSASLEDFVQNEGGIVAAVRDLNSGGTFSVCRASIWLAATVVNRPFERRSGPSSRERPSSIAVAPYASAPLNSSPSFLEIRLGIFRFKIPVAAESSSRSMAATPGWYGTIFPDRDSELQSADSEKAIRTILGVGQDLRL